MRRPPLGEQELALLRFVIDHAPVSVGEAAETFGKAHGLARTTVLTVMARLRKKGYLERARDDGGVYRYSPSVSHAELLRSLVGDFTERMLGGSVQPFVAYLVEKVDLSEEELAALRKLVQRLDDENEK